MAGPYAAWGCFVCIVLDTTSNILSQGEWNTHIQFKRQSDVWRIAEWFAKQFFLLECTCDLLARTTLFEEAVYVYECLSVGVVKLILDVGWGGDVITFLEFAHMVDATQRIGKGVLGLLHKLVALIPYGRAKCQVKKKENTKNKRNLEIISDCWNCDDCTTNECFPSPKNVVARSGFPPGE